MNSYKSQVTRIHSRSWAATWHGLIPRLTVALMTCLLAGLGVATGAWATDTNRVYEWREANGPVSYSQLPPPAGTPGVRSREIDTRSFTAAQTAAVKARLAGIDAAELADARRFRQRLGAADKAVADAVHALGRAEQAFRQGRVPMQGERVGNAGGGSRLRPSYFERQKRLELEVEKAHSRLGDAYLARDGIKP